MFGYIKTYKPELKICEYDAYKAVYCSLCHTLKQDYGMLARFTLHYDYTFLALVRMTALPCDIELYKGRCPYNPLHKCNAIRCSENELSYAAGVAMIMLYYKLQDNIKDDGFWKSLKSRLLLPLAARWRKKAVKRYPEIDSLVADFCDKQAMLEQTYDYGLDRYADLTATALGQIFAFGVSDVDCMRILQNMGYHIGKWVYLLDALDDLQDDRQHQRFNPFLCRLPDKDDTYIAQFAEKQFNTCIDGACSAFELLPKIQFHTIVNNVLYLGLNAVQNNVIKKVQNNA